MRIPADALRWVPATADHLKPGQIFLREGQWWLITEHPDDKEGPFGISLSDGVMGYIYAEPGLTLSPEYGWRAVLDTIEPTKGAPQCGTVSVGSVGPYMFGGYHEQRTAFSLGDGRRLASVDNRAIIYPKWSCEIYRKAAGEDGIAVLFTIDRSSSKPRA